MQTAQPITAPDLVDQVGQPLAYDNRDSQWIRFWQAYGYMLLSVGMSTMLYVLVGMMLFLPQLYQGQINELQSTLKTHTRPLLTDSPGGVVNGYLQTASSAGLLDNQPSGSYGHQQVFMGWHTADSTELDYYHARYSDSDVHQLILSDSAQDNPQSMKPYSYIKENAETVTDPYKSSSGSEDESSSGLQNTDPECGTLTANQCQEAKAIKEQKIFENSIKAYIVSLSAFPLIGTLAIYSFIEILMRKKTFIYIRVAFIILLCFCILIAYYFSLFQIIQSNILLGYTTWEISIVYILLGIFFSVFFLKVAYAMKNFIRKHHRERLLNVLQQRIALLMKEE